MALPIVAFFAACSGSPRASEPKDPASVQASSTSEPVVEQDASVETDMPVEAAPPPGSFEAVSAQLIKQAPETVDDIRHLVGDAPESCKNRDSGQGFRTCVWTLPSHAGPRELKAHIYKELVSSFSLGDGVQRTGAGYSIGLINPGVPDERSKP
jgi:hypothetical protein